MHASRKGKVQGACEDRCGHCKLPHRTHVEDKCLFDATSFRKETIQEHLLADCDCEMIVEEAPTTRSFSVTPGE